MNPYYKRKSAAQEKVPAKQDPANRDAQKVEATETGSTNLGATILEDFDMRRAILYAEILKPKFDE